MTDPNEASAKGNPPLALELVPAAPQDCGFFVSVHHAAYRQTVSRMFDWDEQEQTRIAQDKFQIPGMHIIVHQQTRVGVVGWARDGEDITMRELFVLPRFQNGGIGTATILRIQTIARKAGARIRLRTLSANLKAIALYERLGFTVCDKTDIHVKMIWTPA